MGFLYGPELSSEIASALKGGRRDFAVAYWGQGAAKRLELEDAVGIRIICDLWSGCCNPYELEYLMCRGAEIWDSPRLHAKVYIGEHKFITTSANASINGLGEEGEATEREAGFVSSDTAQHRVACDWFEGLLRVATPVTDLRELRKWWDNRLPSPRRQPVGLSLLQRAVLDPSSLPGVGFVFLNCMSDDEAIAEAKRSAAPDAADKAAELAEWNPRDMFTEWDPEVIRRWPGEFFEFYFEQPRGLNLRALRLDVRSEGAQAVFCSPDWQKIARPLRVEGQLKARLADAKVASEFMQRLEGGVVFRNAQELSARFRELMPDVSWVSGNAVHA